MQTVCKPDQQAVDAGASTNTSCKISGFLAKQFRACDETGLAAILTARSRLRVDFRARNPNRYLEANSSHKALSSQAVLDLWLVESFDYKAFDLSRILRSILATAGDECFSSSCFKIYDDFFENVVFRAVSRHL